MNEMELQDTRGLALQVAKAALDIVADTLPSDEHPERGLDAGPFGAGVLLVAKALCGEVTPAKVRLLARALATLAEEADQNALPTAGLDSGC